MTEWHGYALIECSYTLNAAQCLKFAQVERAAATRAYLAAHNADWNTP